MENTGVIKNRVKDVMDEARFATLSNPNPEAEIESIHGNFLASINSVGRLPIFEKYPQYYLSQMFDKMPHGIVNKRVTGIGATRLEIKSERNSIIVVPTRHLAKSKAEQHKDCLYVGSMADKKGNSTSKKDIENYIQNNGVPFMKFIVVADSLGRLINSLLEIGIDVYNEFFLMVDEIDLLQSDNSFRPQLESVIDYYFMFFVKNRCLVSATMNEFSNPLFKNECTFDITDTQIKPRNILLLHRKDINGCVNAEILRHNEGKILIAYNSVNNIKQIIFSLKLTCEDCAVLCSESSKDELEEGFYSTINTDGTLPRRINFMTCTYFTGIDIRDRYHLITVSSVQKAYYTLSLNKIVQIYGRCRFLDGILSDTIIFDTKESKYSYGKNYISQYREKLILKAKKVIALHNTADDLSEGDKDLIDLFKIVKNAIKKKATEKFKSGSVELVRYNIEEQLVPAYFNIDFLLDGKDVEINLFSSSLALKERLEKEGHNVTLEEPSISELAGTQEEDQKEKLQRAGTKYDEEISEYLSWLRTVPENNLNGNKFLRDLNSEIRRSKRYKKKVLESYRLLFRYVENDRLLDILDEIKGMNAKAHKALINTVMFWSLGDDHPLKIQIRKSVEIGKAYNAEAIYTIFEPIIKYHFHKTVLSYKCVEFFKICFQVKRTTGNMYLVEKENPRNFKERKQAILKEENNLLRYFII